MNMLNKVLITLRINAPKIAHKKLSIINPGIAQATKLSNIPLMIKVNNPKVRIFIGSVNKMSTGLINALTKPSNNAAIKAAQRLFM